MFLFLGHNRGSTTVSGRLQNSSGYEHLAARFLMEFFSKEHTSLKICGVKTESDARHLVELGVDAVGFNFWPKSKRYLNPSDGKWIKELAGKILRVGVFVNEPSMLPFQLFKDGMIDVVQLHGDETPEQAGKFSSAGIPTIKALGVKGVKDIATAGGYQVDAILLDAHAPKVFGGTGERFDWSLARDFQHRYPHLPMVLAGGITPENAASAISEVSPAALDVASGAEISPGIKDLDKVSKLLAACRSRS